MLLLLPESYVQDEIPNHTCSSQTSDPLTAADRALLAAWRDEGLLYICPRGMYDDWFWM